MMRSCWKWNGVAPTSGPFNALQGFKKADTWVLKILLQFPPLPTSTTEASCKHDRDSHVDHRRDYAPSGADERRQRPRPGTDLQCRQAGRFVESTEDW